MSETRNDYQELKNDFIEESLEHLQVLEDGLLGIENHKNDYERLNVIFRAMHSIKGTAAYLELDKIVDTAHVMENILDELRNGEATVNRSMINYLLKGLDVMNNLIYEIKSGEETNVDYRAFIDEAAYIEKHEKGLAAKVADKQLDVQDRDLLEYEEEEFEECHKYIVLKLASQAFGINVTEIKEIVKFSEITPVPYLSSDVKGLMNLRGEIITITDLRIKLDLEAAYDSKNRIVIINQDDMQLGVIVDQVLEVLEIQPNNIMAPKINDEFNVDYVYGVAETSKEFIMLLDVRKILNI